LFHVENRHLLRNTTVYNNPLTACISALYFHVVGQFFISRDAQQTDIHTEELTFVTSDAFIIIYITNCKKVRFLKAPVALKPCFC